jgi:hypothetical protein
MMSEHDVPGAQRRCRRKIQASAQDLPIPIKRIVIRAPGAAAYLRLAEPGKRRRFILAACLAWRTPARVNRQRTEAGLPI